jgi:hypothetical protein
MKLVWMFFFCDKIIVNVSICTNYLYICIINIRKEKKSNLKNNKSFVENCCIEIKILQ